MLFQLLKSFGLDLPATIAEALAELERRLVAQASGAGLLVALCALAGGAALGALAVGLIALDHWVALAYGPFTGYAVTGGLLLGATLILLAAAWAKAKAMQARSTVGAASGETQGTAQAGAPVPAAGGDLLEPLTMILAKVLSFPATGNPLLDELLFHLRAPARGAVDDAVERAAEMIRSGESEKLFGALGAAAFVGWLLAPQPLPQHTVQ
jgi:hypothetical protein